MADRTLEVVLKLTTGQFKTATQTAQQAVTGLGDAMARAIQRGAHPLSVRLAAATAAANAHRAALQAGKSALEAETAAAQAATRAVDGLAKSKQAATSASKALMANLADMYNAWMGIEKAARIVIAGVNAFIDAGERAAQRERTARMFETLSGGAAAAKENLNAMREATQYTLSETQAMTQAVTLLGLGLARTPQELAQVTAQVTAMAKQFGGLSAESAIQAFTLTISNQSFQRLDAFGLEIADVQRRIEEFTQAGMDAEEAFRMAFLDALNDKFVELGGNVEDNKTVFEQYRAAVEDLKTSFESGLLPVATDVVKVLADLARWLSGDLQERYSALGGDILAGAANPQAFAAQIEQQFKDATSLGGALFAKGDVSGQLKALEQNIIATASSQEELNAGMAVYTELLDAWLSKMPAHVRFQVEQNEFIRDATEATRAYNTVQTERIERDAAIERQDMADKAQAERAALLEREAAIRDVGRQIVAAEREIDTNRDAILEEFATETADIERQRGREAILTALRAGWALEDADRQTAQRRAEIQQQYEQARAQAAAQFAQTQAQAAQQYARQQQDIERDYQQRLADIRRQYEEDEFEATLSRDAAALFRARRRRDDETAQAAQERAEQEGRAEQQYQDALQQAQQTYAQALAQAEQARAVSLAQLEQSLRDELEARRRADERARIEQQMQLQWQAADRQMYLQRRLLQVNAAYQAELTMARQHYEALRALQAAAMRAPYIPGGAGGNSGVTPELFATGGYTAGGLAFLHAGEFVLNPQTTRQLEGINGGRLTQQNVVNRGVTVNANFTGVASGDRAWIEQRLGDFSRDLAGMLS